MRDDNFYAKGNHMNYVTVHLSLPQIKYIILQENNTERKLNSCILDHVL